VTDAPAHQDQARLRKSPRPTRLEQREVRVGTNRDDGGASADARIEQIDGCIRRARCGRNVASLIPLVVGESRRKA